MQTIKRKKNMNKNIKPGYKKTPVGIIPEDWEVKRFEELAERNSERFDPTSGISKMDLELDSFEQGTGRIINIYDSRDYKSSKNVFEKGDVLFGKLRPYLNKYWKATFDGVCSSEIWVFRNKKSISSNYLYLILQTKYFISKSHITSGTKMPRAEWSSIKNAKLPIPPLQEQKSIANCLSTWDSGIEKLTQLIQAKKQQKKGLIQQLLIGKKRLTGFEGEWEKVELGDLFEIGNGKDYKHLGKGNIPVFGTGGLMTFVDDFLYDGESVGIGRKGTIDKPQFLSDKFWTVDTLFYTHSFKNTFPRFVYYLFLTINWLKYNEASGVPSLAQKTIKKIKVGIPSLKEQTAIANILQMADKEIELLEQKLSSFQQQKKGLMQVLLTGKKRLL